MCYGIRGFDNFKAMKELFMAETDATLRYTYASALACGDGAQLQR